VRVIASLVALCLAVPAAAQDIQFETTPVTGLVETLNRPEPPATSAVDIINATVPDMTVGPAVPNQPAAPAAPPVRQAMPTTPAAPTGPATPPQPVATPAPKNQVTKELAAKVQELAGRREFDKAITAITEALAADGNNAELYRLRATIQCRAARLKPCLEDADKAVQADAEYVPAYLFRALARAHSATNAAASPTARCATSRTRSRISTLR